MELKAFIIQLLNEKGGEIHGRVQLQKIVYFCKAMGVKVNASYKLYIYGPYSQQVADALQDCVMDDILKESNGIIRKGMDFDEYMQSIADSENILSDTSRKIVKEVLQRCNQLTTKELEITATTFFIDRQQKALFGSDSKETVIKRVSKAKGNRFAESEIEDSYQRVANDFWPLERKYSVMV